MNTSLKSIRVLFVAVAALALASVSAISVGAQGLRNCLDITGKQSGQVACYEMVWVNGTQLKMTFSNQDFKGATPDDRIGSFYVLAPQTDVPQGTLPFAHDHVVGGVPMQNHGDYKVHLHGYFVFCSAQGISSGSCVPTMTAIEGFGTVPFALTVNGQPLTSAGAIDSAANTGMVTLIDTGGVIIGSLGSGQ